MKRFFCLLLTAALALCLAVPPAYAQEGTVPPVVDFTVELYDILTAGALSLFACITPDTSDELLIRAQVTHNGTEPEGPMLAWNSWGADTERYLFSPAEEPYTSYLADKTPFTLQFDIYYKFSAQGEEYGPVRKEVTLCYPTEYSVLDMSTHTVYGAYGSTVTAPRLAIKYNITAVRGSTAQEIAFPTRMPVNLQVHKGRNAAWTGDVFYGVSWQTNPSSADESTAIYPLAGLSLPVQDTDFLLRNRLYRFSATGAADAVAYPSAAEIMSMGRNAALYVNFVEAGYIPTVALVWNNRALEAIFDYKPTGAQALEVYTSVDGESWSLSNTIDCTDGLPEDIPKNVGYDVPILSQQQEEALLAASHEDPAKQGFYVRLRIVGGALGNRETAADGSFTYTETAALPWPETYEFTPGEPGSGTGSGGNLGNVGNGGGERPDAPANGDSTAPDDSRDENPDSSVTGNAPHLHDWGQRRADAKNHFYKCGSCGALDEVNPHTPDATGRCVVCGYAVTPAESAPESTAEPESTADADTTSAPEASSTPESTAEPEDTAVSEPESSLPESSAVQSSASEKSSPEEPSSGNAPESSSSVSRPVASTAKSRILPAAVCVAAAATAAVLLVRRRRQKA